MAIKIMSNVFEFCDLSSTYKLMMLALADHADDYGVCYPGVKRLAHKCRCSSRQAQNILRKLEEMGEIKRVMNKGAHTETGSTNRYIFNSIYVKGVKSSGARGEIQSNDDALDFTQTINEPSKETKRVLTPPKVGVVAPQKSIQTDTPKSPSQLEGTGDSTLTPNVSSGDTELENVPPRADAPPATRKPKSKKSMNDSAGSSKGAGYQMVFGAVAKHVFRIADTEQAPIKRVGLIAGYLWGTTKAMQAPPRPKSETPEQRPANIVKDLEAFVTWYQVKYRDASLPLDLAKFAGHWLAFWATRKNVYEARQYEGVVWGAIETPKLDTPKDTDRGGRGDTIGVKAMDFILSQLDKDDSE